MKLKFIDYVSDGQTKLSIGTCDFCFDTASVDDAQIILRDVDTNDVYYVNMYEYRPYGDYAGIYIDNILEFALWLDENEVRDRDDFDDDFCWLDNIVDDYIDSRNVI